VFAKGGRRELAGGEEARAGGGSTAIEGAEVVGAAVEGAGVAGAAGAGVDVVDAAVEGTEDVLEGLGALFLFV